MRIIGFGLVGSAMVLIAGCQLLQGPQALQEPKDTKVYAPASPVVTQAQIDAFPKLRHTMTESDVKTMMGNPTSIQSNATMIQYNYGPGNGITIDFQDGKIIGCLGQFNGKMMAMSMHDDQPHDMSMPGSNSQPGR